MSVFLLGDLAFNGCISDQPWKNSKRFQEVALLLNAVDFVFANLEVPIKVDDSKNEHKNFIYYSLPEPTKELLNLLNIGCVSLANNHIYDCKMPGLRATINILDELGVYHTGAGWLPDHLAPVLINIKGCKIAFLAYVDKRTNPKIECFPELLINYFEPEKVAADLFDIKEQADIIICSIHWGVDYSFYPIPDQIKISRKLIDSGVDVIMGHHPHTLQPYEEYKSGLIFYSLGGLTFGDYIKEGQREAQALFRKTKKGVMVELDTETSIVNFTSTHELKDNIVTIIPRDFRSWSRRKWLLHKLKHSSQSMTFLFDFKEKVIDRIHEYFFGYYKSPIRRALQFSNAKKIQKLFKEL